MCSTVDEKSHLVECVAYFQRSPMCDTTAHVHIQNVQSKHIYYKQILQAELEVLSLTISVRITPNEILQTRLHGREIMLTS